MADRIKEGVIKVVCEIVKGDEADVKMEARFVEGSPPRAIAAAIGWTANAVSVALVRALAALRSCVELRVSRG